MYLFVINSDISCRSTVKRLTAMLIYCKLTDFFLPYCNLKNFYLKVLPLSKGFLLDSANTSNINTCTSG